MPPRKVAEFDYKDEREFEKEYVIPKLASLGFDPIWPNHGSHEHGKDLIIASIDPLKGYSYHGVQVKYEHIASGNSVESIINDAKQAFRMPFEHRRTGQICRITSFYVLNGGNITVDARTQFFAELRDQHGTDIGLFAGDELKALIAVDRPTLDGLDHEVHMNERRMQQLLSAPDDPRLVRTLRCAALDQFLARPTMRDLLDVASSYFEQISIANQALERFQDIQSITSILAETLDAGNSFSSKINNMRSFAGIDLLQSSAQDQYKT
jgi:hypothetical protein